MRWDCEDLGGAPGAVVPAAGTPSQANTGLFRPDPVEIARLMAAIKSDLGSRYELLGYLGRGAYATVWRARDSVTGDLVAVKRIEGGVRGGTFYGELRALFRLQHPRVVRIVNLSETAAGARYFVLEYCAGGSLREAISQGLRRGERCPARRAAVLGCQLAEGLAEAHRLDLVHRDLKPENVLFVTADPAPFAGRSSVKLADFGLARALQHTESTAGVARGLSGTPAYMAPEQFSGRYTTATDLYALGVILYELLHGRRPFEGGPEHLAYQHLRAVPSIESNLPPSWHRVLAALLEKDPKCRPTADEVRRVWPGPDAPRWKCYIHGLVGSQDGPEIQE